MKTILETIADALHYVMPGVRAISDLELCALKEKYHIKIEGEVTFVE